MGAVVMRNLGLLLALALVVFLVHKHLQTVPRGQVAGGAFSQETDATAGDSGGGSQFNDQFNLIPGNPSY